MRVRRKNRRSEPAPAPAPAPAAATDDSNYDYDDDETYTHVEPQRASEMIGGSGVSLDGQSLILPPDGASYAGQSMPEYGLDMSVGGNSADNDDLSSINTSTYNGGFTRQDFAVMQKEDQEEQLKSKTKGDQELDDDVEQNAPAMAAAATPPTDPKTKRSDTTSAASDDKSDKGGGCLPIWIADAPTWLKIVIALSTLLLLGAIVLIGVGAALAVQDTSDNDNGSSASSFQDNPMSPPVMSPVQPPPGPGETPVEPPVESPMESPVETPVEPPAEIPVTESPSPVPSPAPSQPDDAIKPTSQPSLAPSKPITPVITFFAIAGRFLDESRQRLRDTDLPSLPTDWDGGNVVMFHLGDWNSPFATACDEESYLENVALYAQSSVPVYFVVGDNEYNDCPEPDVAFQRWNDNFLGFESEKGLWDPPKAWTIERQAPNYPENFAYVYKNTLFVGINLVGGVIHDQREWNQRLDSNLRWIDNQYNTHRDEIETMIILGHSSPIIEVNKSFFETFESRVPQEYADVLVVFVHRNLGTDPWKLEKQYNGISNLVVVVVQGSIWPPMKIDFDTSNLEIFIDQGNWYNEYLASSSGQS